MDAPDYKSVAIERGQIVIALSYAELLDAHSRGFVSQGQMEDYMEWVVAQAMRTPVVGTVFGAGTR